MMRITDVDKFTLSANRRLDKNDCGKMGYDNMRTGLSDWQWQATLFVAQ